MASTQPAEPGDPADLIDLETAVELSRELQPPNGKSYNTLARWLRQKRLTTYRNGIGEVRVSMTELRELLTFKAAT